jgi:cellulose biosynthesis protein BcsQ
LHLFENKLAKHWSEAFLGEPQAVRIVTSIRKICEEYTNKFGYDVVLIDTSPSLGALNKVIISSADAIIIPCAPDMFSDYGIRNIGNALSVWYKEFTTMYSLLSDSKRKYFPNDFVKLLGYTIYNAKKRSDAPNELNVALAHYNFARKIPDTIKNMFHKIACSMMVKAILKPLWVKIQLSMVMELSQRWPKNTKHQCGRFLIYLICRRKKEQ